MFTKIPILWNEKKDCCGCSACVAICSRNAIKMKYDKKGFSYPIINKELCVNCGSCVKICGLKNNKRINGDKIEHIYAVQASEEILEKSSSGGMFEILSDEFLQNGNAVISAVYDYKLHEMKSILYDNKKIREKAHGSKYIQSNMGKIYGQAMDWLKNHPNKKILFVGTGCQAAGFMSFAEKKGIRKKIVFVDLICHGVPSQGLWKKYVNYIEKKQGGKLKYITFKNKRKGWENPSAFGIVKGKEVPLKGYSEWFYGRYSLRESCFFCPYTKIERYTDITIGDYWGVRDHHPEFYNPNGVSLALIHSNYGKKLFENVSNKIKYILVKKNECMQPRLIKPAKRPRGYNMFWKDINERGIEYCISKYRERTTNFVTRSLKKIIALTSSEG